MAKYHNLHRIFLAFKGLLETQYTNNHTEYLGRVNTAMLWREPIWETWLDMALDCPNESVQNDIHEIFTMRKLTKVWFDNLVDKQGL